MILQTVSLESNVSCKHLYHVGQCKYFRELVTIHASSNYGLWDFVFIQNHRFEGITIIRNGGTHGNVSVSWVIIRNSSDPSPVTADLLPEAGEISFAQGEMLVTLHLNIIDDDIPEEAEPYLLKLLAYTIQGGAEVSEPSEVSLL